MNVIEKKCLTLQSLKSNSNRQAVERKYICLLYGGGSGNAHTVTI